MRNPVSYLSPLILVLPTVLFAAKNDTPQHHDAFTPGTADESKIAREVRHQLLTLPYYGVFDDLAFRVDGDTVTLLGATANTTLKRDAESAIKHVEGVSRVVNQIDLLPVSSMDDQIRRAVFRAIYGDPALSTIYGYRSIPPIHIIVKNGNVTLEGVVANQMDKNLANIRANSVSGVFSVTNNLMAEK
ncbi:MAG: BON domain-containing protein [Bryobacterales bacterium]|nr:BON domain-containing protein [Bryobacterales bacterium]MBV9401778.1 BON domain-containing protein [Bryobacterales bacterium]